MARREGRPGGDREERGGERGRCTWSQPPSFPSPLPGSPRLHRTPWLPGPPHPCAQPLQKQPPLAPRPPRLRLRTVVRMLLAQLAPPRLREPSLCPLKLLLAAMTAPRAGRGVRVRGRRPRPPRGGAGTRGLRGGPRRAGGLGAGWRAGARAWEAVTRGGAPLKRRQVCPGPGEERPFPPGAGCFPASHPPTWEGALASAVRETLTLVLLLP